MKIAGAVNKIYPCILVFVNEKNINGMNTQMHNNILLWFFHFFIDFQVIQIKGI